MKHIIPENEHHLHCTKVACTCDLKIEGDTVTHSPIAKTMPAKCFLCVKRNQWQACANCKGPKLDYRKTPEVCLCPACGHPVSQHLYCPQHGDVSSYFM